MVESLHEDVILSLVSIDFPDVCIASSNLFRAISVVLPCTCMHARNVSWSFTWRTQIIDTWTVQTFQYPLEHMVYCQSSEKISLMLFIKSCRQTYRYIQFELVSYLFSYCREQQQMCCLEYIELSSREIGSESDPISSLKCTKYFRDELPLVLGDVNSELSLQSYETIVLYLFSHRRRNNENVCGLGWDSLFPLTRQLNR